MTSPHATGTPAGGSHVLLGALADELARSGVRHACTSPGSRSSPIVLALAREPKLRCWSHIDERVSGFFALGLAKATGDPVAIACTSGTAAAELLPAVIEAHEAGVPLIVLSADRPPELRGVGAGQAIDQIKLYGSAVRMFTEVGVDDPAPANVRWIRGLAARAVRAAWGHPGGWAGPVHLNLPLREPLLSPPGLPPDPTARPDQDLLTATRPRPFVETTLPNVLPGEIALQPVHERIRAARRIVVVAGESDRGQTPKSLLGGPGDPAADFAVAAGAPILADPLSRARTGTAAVAHYDALLRDPGFAGARRPDLVIRVGALPTSKPLRQWLAGLDAEQIAIEAPEPLPDPDGAVSLVSPLDAFDALRSQAADGAAADPGWLVSWRDADAAAAAAIESALGDGLSEPRIAAAIGARLPDDATLYVASSMPIRDAETFFPVRDEPPPRVLANRGANGIDGTVAAALGAAAAGDGPTALLIGDVALAYDATALISARRHGLDLAVVLINNGGGGIFEFLPVAAASEIFEEHVATPPGLDFAAVAAAFGAAHELINDAGRFGEAFDAALAPGAGVRILEVRTDRTENVEAHRRCWAAVAAALGS